MLKLKTSLEARDVHPLSCYGCGQENSFGLKARVLFDEEKGEVRFDYKPRPFQGGIPGVMHGGILAALMDEAQGVLCKHLGYAVMTDRLTIKYHKAGLTSDILSIRAWLTMVRKRRLHTKAALHNQKTELLVNSTAVWYILPERIWRRIWPQEEEKLNNYRALLERNRRRGQLIRRRLRHKALAGSK